MGLGSWLDSTPTLRDECRVQKAYLKRERESKKAALTSGLYTLPRAHTNKNIKHTHNTHTSRKRKKKGGRELVGLRALCQKDLELSQGTCRDLQGPHPSAWRKTEQGHTGGMSIESDHMYPVNLWEAVKSTSAGSPRALTPLSNTRENHPTLCTAPWENHTRERETPGRAVWPHLHLEKLRPLSRTQSLCLRAEL